MSQESRYRVSFLMLLLMALLLLWLTLLAPPSATDVLLGGFFGALIVFTTTFGVPLAGGAVSALPMVTAAAYLVLGLVPAGWAAFLGALVHGWVRYRFAELLELEWYSDREEAPGLAAINAAIQSASILAGGVVFRRMGGVTPLITVNAINLLPLIFLGLTYLSVNHLIAGFYIWARGQAQLELYIRLLPRLIFYEGSPLVFAPLMALTYTRLGLAYFLILDLGLAVSPLIVRNLALARARLERKVKELDSLQAVGRAISASLDLETTLSAIYTQVAQLMPASGFCVALYDPHTDEVSFPLVIEEGQRVHWPSRRAGNGLAEHVLRIRAPLLI